MMIKLTKQKVQEGLIHKIIFVALVVILASTSVWAGSTGKIQGRVTDAETGEPLIGANVLVANSQLGASTDEEGRYVILQVPPGIYTLTAHYIGYQKINVTEMRVNVDLTTTQNFAMPFAMIQGAEVTVVADRPMVRADVTSTRRSINSDEISSTPSAISTRDILGSQGGVYLAPVAERVSLGGGVSFEPKDPSLKGMNIRGSRGGDAIILIDGFPATHPVYGGFDIMNLNVEDIENIEILTGAFSAEYGQGESAVINITTKSGGDEYRGSINYRTDQPELWSVGYSKDRVAINLSGPEPISNYLLPAIGLKIPGKLKFTGTVTSSLSDTPYNNLRERRPIFTINDNTVHERQDNQLSYNTKFDWRMSAGLKSSLSYRRSMSRWTEFNYMWHMNPDNQTQYANDNKQIQFSLTHTLSNKTYYSINIGYTGVNHQNDRNGYDPDDYWIISEDTLFTVAPVPNVDPLTGFYDASGYESNWVYNKDEVLSALVNWTSQVTPTHLLKAGGQIEFKDLYNIHIYGIGGGFSEYGRFLYQDGDEYPAPPGPYPEFGVQRWLIEGKPIVGGLYLTDKFELEALILNAGVRMDWFKPGSSTEDDEWKAQWERSTGLAADWKKFRYQIDPRFGISFPISTTAVFYFSYGHFNTLPGMDNFLRDPYSGGFTGNPHLDYITTIKNEFGFTWEFVESWALDIKNYNKEISGQIGSTNLKTEYGLPIYLNDNKGYSRARGLEFNLRKQQTSYFGGDALYALQWASGYSSSSFDDYRRSLNNLPNPIDEYRLNWDIRHSVIVRGNIKVGEGQHPKLFGLLLPSNWRLSVQGQFSSGQPYTPGTHDPARAQILTNSLEGQPTLKVGMKFEKYFQIGGSRLTLGLDVDNLFDQLNVNPYRGFNVWTGEPYIYGDRVQDTQKGIDYYDMLHNLDPSRFGEGRHIDLIMDWTF